MCWDRVDRDPITVALLHCHNATKRDHSQPRLEGIRTRSVVSCSHEPVVRRSASPRSKSDRLLHAPYILSTPIRISSPCRACGCRDDLAKASPVNATFAARVFNSPRSTAFPFPKGDNLQASCSDCYLGFAKGGPENLFHVAK